MTKWFNYFVTNKFSRLTNGHVSAENLLKTILEHDGSEAYACYFDLDYSALKEEFDTGKRDKNEKPIYEYHDQGSECPLPSNGITFTSYEGTCRPALNCVAFDFDGTSDDDALNDVRRFIQWLNIDDAVVFFSGSKGFHVLIHFDYFNLSSGPDLVLQLKDLAKYLEKHFPTLDSGIYNYNRKFRVPFTKHDKSGLYKTLIPLDCLDEDMGRIRGFATQMEKKSNFLPPAKERLHNPQISEAIEGSKRASYEIEKHHGTVEKPSAFEAYDGKLCIKKMLSSRCDGQINNARMRIVNDFYRTGVTYSEAETRLAKWSAESGGDTRKDAECLDDIYNQRKVYNFGCQDELKSSFCSAKCPIWSKLTPDKRPTVIDAPKSAAMESEKAKRISQKEVVGNLLRGEFGCQYNRTDNSYYGGRIVKQDGDIFLYDDDYWHEAREKHTSQIKQRIDTFLEGKGTISQIENVYKMFCVFIPNVPEGVDLFTPPRDKINFNNGVVSLMSDKTTGKLSLRFERGHRATDYLTAKHNFNYEEVANPLDTCKEFIKVLSRLFKGCSDIEERIKSVAMMYGGSLMPNFPMIYHLYGPAKTGKSTVIQILMELLDERNMSHVQPKDFYGFNLESMVGKLVNCTTEIDIHSPIKDDMVKQILDKNSITVRRKNRTDIIGNMPCMHLFAGNGLPKSFEVSNALDRRMTLIPFENVIDDSESYFATSSDFAKHVFKQESQGILNFSIYGLKLLVENNGRFIQFNSSKNAMKDMQENSDIVRQFITDITTEGVDMDGVPHNWKCDDESKLPKSLVWTVFNAWQEDAIKDSRFRLGKHGFNQRLYNMGHKYIASNGHWISGFAVRSAVNGSESQQMDNI